MDDIQFGGHHVLVALGVDAEGNKRVLGIREGASENVVVALGLLESLVERGLGRGCSCSTGRRRWAPPSAKCSGAPAWLRRCRNHKMRNGTGHLPKEFHDQARSVLRAAWKLDAKDGRATIEQFTSWLEARHLDAAGSLRE